MSAKASKLASSIRSESNAKLERLAEEIKRQYVNRELQCTTVPMEKRGRNVRRRPRTALISLAAQRQLLKRQVLSLVHWRVEHMVEEPEKDIQELISIRDFLRRGQVVEQSGDGCTPSQF